VQPCSRAVHVTTESTILCTTHGRRTAAQLLANWFPSPGTQKSHRRLFYICVSTLIAKCRIVGTCMSPVPLTWPLPIRSGGRVLTDKVLLTWPLPIRSVDRVLTDKVLLTWPLPIRSVDRILTDKVLLLTLSRYAKLDHVGRERAVKSDGQGRQQRQ
jgi:hypothetical protein